VAQTTCPVTGKPIDKQFFIDYNGKRIYFCTAACIDEFKKAPDKYMQKLSDMGQVPENAPAPAPAPTPAPAPAPATP